MVLNLSQPKCEICQIGKSLVTHMAFSVSPWGRRKNVSSESTSANFGKFRILEPQMPYDRPTLLSLVASLQTTRGLSLREAIRQALLTLPGPHPSTVYRWLSTAPPTRSAPIHSDPTRQALVNRIHALPMSRSAAVRAVLADTDEWTLCKLGRPSFRTVYRWSR